MDCVKYSGAACLPLVAARTEINTRTDTHHIFATVSPNPSTKHKTIMMGRSCQLPYGKLRQVDQYEYCVNIARQYASFLSPGSWLVGTSELNKHGDLHIHMLIYDPKIQTDVALQIFRRDILHLPSVFRNMAKGKDYMNNIVFNNKPIKEIVTYMDKDYVKQQQFFKNFTVDIE